MNLRIRTIARTTAAACLLLSAMTAASAASYTAILTGPKEAPPNSSPGVGATVVTFDATTHVLEVNVAFSGLTGETTAAHIHCCTTTPGSGTAGVATETPTFGSFPLGVGSGAYTNTYDTSLPASWSAAFLGANGGTTAGAEAAFTAGLNSGGAYLNIHSTDYPGGEIRGFLVPFAPVPEPAGYAMLALGLPAVMMIARRRSRKTQA